MELAKYFQLTKKREHKNKPRNTPLPKAKQNYLEALGEFILGNSSGNLELLIFNPK